MLGRTFSQLEVPCPDDVQVVAIAPTDLATNGPWEVSAVDLPIPAIGRTAVAMAVERLGSQEVPAHSRLLSPAFFPRATARPCARPALPPTVRGRRRPKRPGPPPTGSEHGRRALVAPKGAAQPNLAATSSRMAFWSFALVMSTSSTVSYPRPRAVSRMEVS